MENNLELKFIKDEPILSNTESYFEFYHKTFTPALIQILDASNEIKTIGLFGGWGTGKSTVIEQLKENKSFWLFVFDVWKYQDDALRRAFLLELVKYLEEEKHIEFGENFLQELKGLYVTQETAITRDQEVKNENKSFLRKAFELVKKQWHILIIVLSAILWIFVRVFFTGSSPLVASLRELTGYLMFSVPVWFIFSTMAKKTIEELTKNFITSFKAIVETHTITERKDALNSPEQFETLFKKILEYIPDKKRFVIVFDNVDRVEGKIAVKLLTTIKTFLEPAKKSHIAFVIPCDQDSVRQQIIEKYANVNPDEFLRKLFPVIIWIPEFIPTDLEEFTKRLISQTGKNSSLLNQEEVIYIITQAFSRNPRQIKQFINNLISQLIIASKTEVWEIIKDNIAYLAKVLVIRQLYPDGYANLKDHWFEPENIYSKEQPATKEDLSKEDQLRDFMLNTQNITAQNNNAKPFIYFKKPFQVSNVTSADELEQSLIQGRVDDVEKIINKNKDMDSVSNFITGLYSEYKLLEKKLVEIVRTQLVAFSKIDKQINQNSYYIRTINLIDKQLWKNYLDLPTDEVFSLLIKSPVQFPQKYRKILITRYSSLFLNEEISKQEHLLKAQTIINNLLLLPTPSLGESEEKIIRDGIQKYFQNSPSILSLFKTQDHIKKYISDQTINGVIQNINIDIGTGTEFLTILRNYSNRFNKESTNLFLACITQALQKFNESPEFTNPKALFLAELANILFSLSDTISESDKQNIDSLVVQLYTLSKNTSPADNRKDMSSSLMKLFLYTDETHQSQIKEAVNDFLRESTPETLSSFLDIQKQNNNFENLTNNMRRQYIEIFRVRKDCRDILYGRALDDLKEALLRDIVVHTPEKGLDFLPKSGEFPGRKNVITLMLDELEDLQPNDAQGGYAWINEVVKPNDDSDLKERFCNQLINKLKSDDSSKMEQGYNLYINSDFLGKVRRRELAQEIYTWLQESGAVLSSMHQFPLRCVSTAISRFDLPNNVKEDFIKYLLKNIRQQTNTEILNILIDIVIDLNVHYSDSEDEFNDILVDLQTFPGDTNRKLILERLSQMKSKDPHKKEKDFWNSVEEVRKLIQNS